MRLSSPRFLGWILLPAALLVLAAWYQAGSFAAREAALAREADQLRDQLRAGGFSPDIAAINERLQLLSAETALLSTILDTTQSLARDPLVSNHATLPFQLIEFERERAAAAQNAREQAAAIGVNLSPSAFDVLADNSESPPQPRRRWAQLAIAREVAARAIAAKVATYEALPVPAVREIRLQRDSPVLMEEILFSVRVTGDSARVQTFVEYLALGVNPKDLRFMLEHFVLRKDGIATPDQASATVVLAALLPPFDPALAP